MIHYWRRKSNHALYMTVHLFSSCSAMIRAVTFGISCIRMHFTERHLPAVLRTANSISDFIVPSSQISALCEVY